MVCSISFNNLFCRNPGQQFFNHLFIKQCIFTTFSKTILQEIVQADMGESISYRLVGEEGPDHNKSFHVEVCIGESCCGAGKGRTKKAAEQEAAYQAILKLKAGSQIGYNY